MSLDPKDRATKRLTQQEQVLDLLQRAKDRGCTTEELLTCGHRFSAMVCQLRKKGWAIETRDQLGTDSKLYVLDTTKTQVPQQTNLMHAPAPARPSAGPVTGICTCQHSAGQHRPRGGACFDCNCTAFQSQG